MLRWTLILLVFIAGSALSQGVSVGRRINLPPGQLVLRDESERVVEVQGMSDYFYDRFRFPDYLPVTVAAKNIYEIKQVSQIDVFDKLGKLAYTFQFSDKGDLLGGMIENDHRIRWQNYRLAENVIVRVEAHYDKNGKLAKRDSVITTFHKIEPADTVISYTSSRHWVYLSGATVNDRNNYYNNTYFKKHLSVPANALNTKHKGRSGKRHIYLKKKLPVNYKEDSIYLDRFIQRDENFRATAYSDTGKAELYQLLPSSHYIKKRFRPIIKGTYGTAGADFNEPGRHDDAFDLNESGPRTMESRKRMSPDYYKCTLTRRNLIDSIFYEGPSPPPDSVLRSDPPSNARDTEKSVTPVVSLNYTVRYHYWGMAYFSGNEYEPEPQIVLKEQDSRYGQMYYQTNFNRPFRVPSGDFVSLGDVRAFVRNRVKTIHISYRGEKELQAFDLDTAGNIVGELDPHGTRRWRSFFDKAGNRFIVNEYYDYSDGWLKEKDSTVYFKKMARYGDTLVSYQRMESFSFKKGRLINERNRDYNEEYLNKRIKSESFGSIGAPDPNDPKGPKDGYIYLKEALKTNYEDDRFYLCTKSFGDYGFKVTKDTVDITDSISPRHRFRKKLIRPEVVKKLVSGEDFNPPYQFRGPVCGGSGYSDYHSQPDESAVFHSYSWTLNSKGLYDTCYQASPKIVNYSREVDENGSDEPDSEKAPEKFVLYTVKYEYY